MDPILQKFRHKFYEEANGLLDKLETDLLELEKNPNDKELIESAFRAMHTIKGVSGMYGFDFICEYTHSMESIYQAVREAKLTFNKEIFEITFLSIDHIRKLLTDEKLSISENHVNHNKLLKNIALILEKQQVALIPEINLTNNIISQLSEQASWHIMLRTDEKIYFRGVSLVSIFADLSKLGTYKIIRVDYLSDEISDVWSIILSSTAPEDEIRDIFMFIEDNCVITRISDKNLFDPLAIEKLNEPADDDEQSIIEYIEGTLKPKAAEEINKVAESINEAKAIIKDTAIPDKQKFSRISVDSSKLDSLMYLVSELITVNSQLMLSTSGERFETIRPYIEKVDNLSKQFRNNALEIRLVPLSDTILRFQRLIRDLSKQLHKKIELATHGIDTELDKSTIDQLNEPLMHLIRNCIDHGIEMPEVRLQKGKPEAGTIRISAYHSGSYVVIKIEDDGIGINTEKVRQKAIDKGLLKLSDKPKRNEIFELIFLPGFSTALSLSEVSGRGVGMDVVRRKIQDLRGDIMVESEEGVGTTFTLKLQQSVAIIDTLLFKVDDTFFTVPISDINVCSQISAHEVNLRRHTATIPFSNQLIPFIDIRQKLHIKGSYSEKIKVVVLKNNDNQIALLTDKIVGEHQAVLKPLGKSFKNQSFIASASQLGDGNLAFMIDTTELMKFAEITKKKDVLIS